MNSFTEFLSSLRKFISNEGLNFGKLQINKNNTLFQLLQASDCHCKSNLGPVLFLLLIVAWDPIGAIWIVNYMYRHDS